VAGNLQEEKTNKRRNMIMAKKLGAKKTLKKRSLTKKTAMKK
jgi:hypothetical protein